MEGGVSGAVGQTEVAQAGHRMSRQSSVAGRNNSQQRASRARDGPVGQELGGEAAQAGADAQGVAGCPAAMPAGPTAGTCQPGCMWGRKHRLLTATSSTGGTTPAQPPTHPAAHLHGQRPDRLGHRRHGLAQPLAQRAKVWLRPQAAVLEGVCARRQRPHIHLLSHVLPQLACGSRTRGVARAVGSRVLLCARARVHACVHPCARKCACARVQKMAVRQSVGLIRTPGATRCQPWPCNCRPTARPCRPPGQAAAAAHL